MQRPAGATRRSGWLAGARIVTRPTAGKPPQARECLRVRRPDRAVPAGTARSHLAPSEARERPHRSLARSAGACDPRDSATHGPAAPRARASIRAARRNCSSKPLPRRRRRPRRGALTRGRRPVIASGSSSAGSSAKRVWRAGRGARAAVRRRSRRRRAGRSELGRPGRPSSRTAR